VSIDLTKCIPDCRECIKHYIKKHSLQKGETFKIVCTGIPLDFVPKDVLAANPDLDEDTAVSLVDPVAWASRYLDWYCLDPVGEVWKRKTDEGLIGEFEPYTFEQAALGKSPYHRPYQALALRCTARRRVLREGRQVGKSAAICVNILYHLFTKSNFNIVLVAPFQSQIDLLFEAMNELIQGSTLTRSVARYVKSPNYKVEINNGSSVIGFTAGTKSGHEAGVVRGQSAHLLIFDEADMLSRKDLESALATVANFPRARIWISSTPTGKREKFWEACYSKLYREFFYPSMVNPNWSQDLEDYFRGEYTEEGYNHEILAIFGDQEEGVFKNKYITAAQDDYEYEDHQPQVGWLYTIGVDWNDYKIGTTICVIGWNPADGKFFVVYKEIITTQNLTQLVACQRIADLNRKWNPISIYVDKGYGTPQVEILRKYGLDAISDKNRGPGHADAALLKIVKAYDFGGAIETFDPFTKQPIRKPAKPFLVENAVRRFESYNIKYPKSDKKFTAALQGYIIKRVSPTGQPTYFEQNEKIGDHFLDAVNLGLVAFTLERSDFGKPKIHSSIHISNTPLIRFPIEQTPTLFGEEPMVPKKREKFGPNRAELPDSIKNNGTTEKPKPALWAWPGFMRDAPKPLPKRRTKTRPIVGSRWDGRINSRKGRT